MSRVQGVPALQAWGREPLWRFIEKEPFRVNSVPGETG